MGLRPVSAEARGQRATGALHRVPCPSHATPSTCSCFNLTPLLQGSGGERHGPSGGRGYCTAAGRPPRLCLASFAHHRCECNIRGADSRGLRTGPACLLMSTAPGHGPAPRLDLLAVLAASPRSAPRCALCSAGLVLAHDCMRAGKLLGEIVDMHSAELEVKEAVVAGFRQLPGGPAGPALMPAWQPGSAALLPWAFPSSCQCWHGAA